MITIDFVNNCTEEVTAFMFTPSIGYLDQVGTERWSEDGEDFEEDIRVISIVITWLTHSVVISKQV